MSSSWSSIERFLIAGEFECSRPLKQQNIDWNSTNKENEKKNYEQLHKNLFIQTCSVIMTGVHTTR